MGLYLIRHPQTIANLKVQIAGWAKSPYSEEGKKQFEKINHYFKKNKINLPVYSSDLPRALKLAKEISNENKSKLTITKELREINFKETEPYDSYETQSEFEKRIFKFLKENQDSDKIIVSHSGVIRYILKMNNSEWEKNIGLKRDRIFLIETNKKGNKLKIIRV